MQKRLIRWFFLNLFFALTPLIAVLVVRWLASQLSIQTLQDNSSEILFFALMVSVTTLGDLSDIVKPFSKDYWLDALRLFLILSAAWSALLYGVFLFDHIIGVNVPDFRFKLMVLSISLAVILFLVTTAAQVFLARVLTPKGRKP